MIVVGVQHVVPTEDLIEHNTEPSCICGPQLAVVPVEVLIGETPTEAEGTCLCPSLFRRKRA